MASTVDTLVNSLGSLLQQQGDIAVGRKVQQEKIATAADQGAEATKELGKQTLLGTQSIRTAMAVAAAAQADSATNAIKKEQELAAINSKSFWANPLQGLADELFTKPAIETDIADQKQIANDSTAVLSGLAQTLKDSDKYFASTDKTINDVVTANRLKEIAAAADMNAAAIKDKSLSANSEALGTIAKSTMETINGMAQQQGMVFEVTRLQMQKEQNEFNRKQELARTAIAQENLNLSKQDAELSRQLKLKEIEHAQQTIEEHKLVRDNILADDATKIDALRKQGITTGTLHLPEDPAKASAMVRVLESTPKGKVLLDTLLNQAVSATVQEANGVSTENVSVPFGSPIDSLNFIAQFNPKLGEEEKKLIDSFKTTQSELFSSMGNSVARLSEVDKKELVNNEIFAKDKRYMTNVEAGGTDNYRAAPYANQLHFIGAIANDPIYKKVLLPIIQAGNMNVGADKNIVGQVFDAIKAGHTDVSSIVDSVSNLRNSSMEIKSEAIADFLLGAAENGVIKQTEIKPFMYKMIKSIMVYNNTKFDYAGKGLNPVNTYNVPLNNPYTGERYIADISDPNTLGTFIATRQLVRNQSIVGKMLTPDFITKRETRTYTEEQLSGHGNKIKHIVGEQ